ncbi:Transglycosylase SLT domain-containing protein [Selenomonas ruminantium]|uniref:Transglycosylase SLT domain-containing protein n=1 Tax=Selenomonas ruminantium TaxID=971 RepID=A0A1I3F5C8_SELRU|nr:lytic transglycosylase domain-containing protein [Selenomonas ruminantium]SFI06445.1 Transglycosylase SLT domain-containing protein [Selenomonas ruminantium]
MINLMGVRAVQARIAQLQQQFGLPGPVPGLDFQKKLDKEMQRGGAAGAAAAGAAGKAAAQTPKEAVVHSAGSNGAANPFASYSVNSSLPVADQNLSSLIDAAARKYNVDPKLVSAVAEVESGGDQDAASSAGAVGVMQLMPDTAAALGVNPYDKKSNIEGGAKYLRQMLDAFDGDVRRAVAAYNAGPQAVKDYGGVPPYQETQNYVNKVLDIYR